jgi:hypothetical protein
LAEIEAVPDRLPNYLMIRTAFWGHSEDALPGMGRWWWWWWWLRVANREKFRNGGTEQSKRSLLSGWAGRLGKRDGMGWDEQQPDLGLLIETQKHSLS